MRHYRLTPVRLAADGLQWLPCAEALRQRYAIEYQDYDRGGVAPIAVPRWFADVSPHSRELAERFVMFLNTQQE